MSLKGEKVNNMNKKLVFTIVSFIIATSTLIGTTYAWFAVSSSVKAENFALTGVSSDKLQIGLKNPSTGKIDFFDEVGSNLLVDYSQQEKDAKLEPVSGMYQNLWYNADNYNETLIPQFRSRYYKVGNNIHESTLATSGFYQYEIYLKTTANVSIHLDEKTSVLANEIENQIIANFLGYSIEDLNKIKDCLRISFLTNRGYFIYEPNVSTSSETLFAGKLDINPTDKYYDYSLNNEEVLYGEYNYNDSQIKYYDVNPQQTTPSQFTSFDALTAKGVKAIDFDSSINQGGLVMNKETSYSLVELQNMDLLHLESEVPERMVISIYIEGWDRQTVDAVASSNFNVNLVFGANYLDY